MISIAWAQIRANGTRLTAVLAAIVLGTLFLAATAVFASTAAAGLRAVAAAPLTAADVVVDQDRDATGISADWPDLASDHDGVAAVSPYHASTEQLVADDMRGTANVYSIAEQPELRWFGLEEGEWPTTADEVVTDRPTLDAAGLSLGDTLTLSPEEGPEAEATVVGVADIGFRPLTGVQYQVYATEHYFEGELPVSAMVDTAEGVSATQVTGDLNAALPDGLHATTAEEQAQAAADRFAGGSQQLEYILLAFALISLLAAAMVISNTFAILLSQRRRDTALLRLVGAERTQVRTMVVVEALIVGTAGAAIGLALGIGAGYGGASLMGLTGDGLHLSVPALAGTFVVGVATTVCAAWFPARKAASTPPVVALRSAPLQGQITFRAVHGIGAIVAVLGVAVMVFGMVGGVLPLALGGGFLGAIGLLLVLRLIIARLIGGFERLTGSWTSTFELAGANLRRNTGRAATATLALVLGLGLITSLATAAATGRATIDSDLNDRYPVDVSARVDGGSVETGTVEAVRAVDELDLVEAPSTADVTVEGLGGTTLVGVSPALAERTGADELAPGEGGAPAVLMSDEQVTELGVSSGETVDLTIDGVVHPFTVHTSNMATVAGTAAPVVQEEVLDAVAGEQDRSMVWGVAATGADTDVLAEEMNQVAGADPEIELGGALSERRDITEVLDILVNLSLGMLLITVVISTLGVANTLSLSILERTRESALLRALGLTRGGLKRTLAVEATVISVLGALLGLVLGVPYGLVGVNAVVGETAPLVVDVPWGSFGLVLGASVLIGLVATLLPARRAARIAPAEGLAGD